ncbi:MAG: alpha-L-fucosidase [Thermoguttaceae bacterium]|jgi:alpha-L-fucosidase
MNRDVKIRKCLALASLLATILLSANAAVVADKLGPTANLPIASGPFKPTWEALKQYECPEWFRDAKFGIWAHWSAQCLPEDGDWYARGMYEQGSGHYKYHVEHYGHPSKVGFKDICNLWKAEKWEPKELIQLYKRAGAKYFVALANHHCNFDCWDSKYQPWNSVNIGPKKDIVGTWAKAARQSGLRFGVTVHCARSWDWYDVAHGSDKSGPLKGVPYDGILLKAAGRGKWWEGYDPAELYGPHGAARTAEARQAYIDKWFNRTRDLIDKYDPDLLYFDDGMNPLGEAGMNIFAHFYNANIQRHDGKLEAVLNTKGMPNHLLKCLVHDFERGRSSRVEKYPWQTDTCIGEWHYHRGIGYRSVREVVTELVEIVSKNGNLLLNIPVRGDGTIDDREMKFLEGMTQWMDINGEGIFSTRPFTIYGETNVRFTAKGDTLYAFFLGWPDKSLTIRALAKGSPLVTGEVTEVRLLGHDAKLDSSRTEEGLTITVPEKKPCDYAVAFKITGLKAVPGAEPNVFNEAIKPAAKGSLQLDAEVAELHGSLQVESKGDVPNIGFWDNPQDTASWNKVKFVKPGTYDVEILVASPHEGAELAVVIGDQERSGTVPQTGDFANFQTATLGKITVKQAGEFVVTARPHDAKTWKAINLSRITLKPTK